jgi:hypothetical protein
MNLPSTITLNAKAYTFYEVENGDKVVFHGPDHTDTTRQTLEFIRTEPKRSGNDYGVRRGYIRFTEDIDTTQADASAKTAQLVSNASINWPVGIDTDATVAVQNQMMNIWGCLSGEEHGNPGVSWTSNTKLVAIVAFFVNGQI